MSRKPLGKGTYGTRGRSVRLWIEGDLIRAQYRERGARKTKSWPNTPENRAYAKVWAAEFVATRERPALPRRVTSRELWARYTEAEWPSLRPRSQKIYADAWRAWEVFVTPHSFAEDLGFQTVAEFRADRTRHGWAVGTTRKAIDVVKGVYAWGMRAKLLTRNEVRDYRFKVAKEERVESPAEYAQEEFDRIVAQLPLDAPGAWRPRAVLEVCGLQGARQNAVLHLKWADLDLEAGVVTWRAAWDKTGAEWTQPLRRRTIAVLRAVQAWHERLGLEGPWVFPKGSRRETASPVYTAQSLWAALCRAERAAGVPHLPRRGAHGLRRMLFGDVLAATGSLVAAMNTINDRDLRVAGRYNKTRMEEIGSAFSRLDNSGNETATAPALGAEADNLTGGVE